MKKGYRYYLVVNNSAIRLPYRVIVGLLRAGMLVRPGLTWTIRVDISNA